MARNRMPQKVWPVISSTTAQSAGATTTAILIQSGLKNGSLKSKNFRMLFLLAVGECVPAGRQATIMVFGDP